MTNMRLLINDLPLCALGRNEERRQIYAAIIRPITSCFFKIPLSLGGLCLLSFMDQ